MRLVEIMATRLWRRQANGNKNYERARNEASKLYFNKKRNMVKAGLINTGENLANGINKLVPPNSGNAARRAAVIRKNVPAAVVRKNAPNRKINAKLDMFEYTINSMNIKTPANAAKGLRVNGKKVMQMERQEINKILVRVGADPSIIKTKQAAALAILGARRKYVKPYKTLKQKENEAKKFGNELMAAKEKRENEETNRYYKALAARRNPPKNNAVVNGKPQKSKGKLQLFSKLGLTK
jgi:hypothetical protein